MRASLVLTGICILAVAYFGTILGLAAQWWEYLNHGLALVALVAWVAWRDRDELLAFAIPWWPALTVIIAGTLVWFLGASAEIQVLEQLGLLVVIIGWPLAVLGAEKLPRLLRLGGYLALSMPAWGFLVSVLQKLTVFVNGGLLAIVGLDATITGTFISIPAGTFEVAGSCAGQAFLMSGLTVGVAYWEVVPLSRRGRWLALALMGSLSIISNWIRVFLLILIGQWTAMKSPLMADHGWFGWVLFAGMVLVFVWLSRLLEAKYAMHPSGRSVGPSAQSTPGTVMPTQGSLAAWGKAYSLPIIVFTAFATSGPIATEIVKRLPRDPSPERIAELQLPGGWTLSSSTEQRPLLFGDSIPKRPWRPRYVGADRHQVMLWTNAIDTVRTDRLVFSGRDHRHKLFAEGNQIGTHRAVILDRPIGIADGVGVRSFRQAIVQTDTNDVRAILYWFRVGNSATGLPLVGRLQQAIAFLNRSAPSELVAISERCDGDCTSSFRLLHSLIQSNESASSAGLPRE